MIARRITILLPRSLTPGGLWKVYNLWRDRARQRRRLLELDDRMLRDIGVTRSDVVRESDKPFWEA
ncbi:MAG: DUF1127 domain-containing protein [Alphaproteobacteria bacterium]